MLKKSRKPLKNRKTKLHRGDPTQNRPNEDNEAIGEESNIDKIAQLSQRITDEAPERGYQSKADPSLLFSSYPLSDLTLRGLEFAKLTNPTDIQAAAIPHSLVGRDILGIAKTGSGKTIAFTVPLLERLYHERWDAMDGLAAIVISPTRELAYQIFQVLRIVGKFHQYSAGLITGGMKEFEMEQERIIRMNIIVATPGRLLQHFEQTSGFDASQLLVLILDEADRILDMGFKSQLDSILEYLPSTRQTMFFSATQTKSVKDLARLSLKDPEYLAVHSKEEYATPKQLIQNYSVCKLEEKLDVLFSFIKTHLQSKIMVFFSTCSQVRFAFECFRGLQPGIVLTSLHGKIKQERRTSIYMDFVKRKAVCMFATDIAARGLDFPDVDWVVQVDAPEDTAMYIHRVGRTARYNAGGRALMLLLAEEEQPVIDDLKQNGVPITKLTVNSKFKVSIASRAAALLASRPETKELAKKAFTGYLRSLQLTPQQRIDVSSLQLGEFAKALGLPFTPPLPLLNPEASTEEREAIRSKKNVNRSLDKLKKQIKEAKEEKRRQRLQSQEISSSHRKSSSSDDEEEEDDSEEEEEFFQVKQTHDWNQQDDEDEPVHHVDTKLLSRSQLKKLKAAKIRIREDGFAPIMEVAGSKKIVFDDSDKDEDDDERDQDDESVEDVPTDHKISQHIAKLKARVDQGRFEDEIRDKERIRQVHKLRRLKEKGPKLVNEDDDDDEGVQLASYHGSDSDQDSDPYDEEEESINEPIRRRGRDEDSDEASSSSDRPIKKSKHSHEIQSGKKQKSLTKQSSYDSIREEEERILQLYG